MRREEVARLYDREYARAYDGRFLLGGHNQPNSDFEIALLRSLLNQDSRWLDIGCGTGYFLAEFPGIARAGLDLSPSMLAEARARNPDALFLSEGDFREPVPDWVEAWTLVSCMWAPYSYVETIGEVSQVVTNMVNWTAPGGAVLIPTIDLPYLGENVPYRHEVAFFGGTVLVNGYVWSWQDEGGARFHEHMILPHTGQVMEWLAPHFERLRVVRYPLGRRAVLATGRRAAPNAGAEICWDAPTTADAKSAPVGEAPLTHLVSEVVRRLNPLRIWRRPR